MGEILLATDTRLDRQVVLKILCSKASRSRSLPCKARLIGGGRLIAPEPPIDDGSSRMSDR
jgi:hypothetical protein